MEDERLEVEKRVWAWEREGSGKQRPFNNFLFTSRTKFYQTFINVIIIIYVVLFLQCLSLDSSYFRGYTIYNL